MKIHKNIQICVLTLHNIISLWKQSAKKNYRRRLKQFHAFLWTQYPSTMTNTDELTRGSFHLNSTGKKKMYKKILGLVFVFGHKILMKSYRTERNMKSSAFATLCTHVYISWTHIEPHIMCIYLCCVFRMYACINIIIKVVYNS